MLRVSRSLPPSSTLCIDYLNITSFCFPLHLQLSLKYDSDLEDLRITLHKVIGQSNKEIHDSADVFINTYLIPDMK